MKTELEHVLKWSQEKTYSLEPPLFVRKLVDGGLTYKQILVVLNAVDTTCLSCFDGDENCQCWNDE